MCYMLEFNFCMIYSEFKSLFKSDTCYELIDEDKVVVPMVI